MIKYLLPFIKRSIRAIAVLFIISSVASVTSMYAALLSGNFIDMLTSRPNINGLLSYCSFFAAITLLGLLMSYMAYYYNTRYNIVISNDIIGMTLKKLLNPSMSYSKKGAEAYLSNRINTDANSLVQFALSTMQNIVAKLISILFSCAFFVYNRSVFGFVFAAIVIIYVFLYVAFKKALFQTTYNVKEQSSKYVGAINEVLVKKRSILANSVIDGFLIRYDNVFSRFLSVMVKYQTINNLYTSLDGFILTVSNISLFIFGGYEIIRGKMSVGEFTVVLSYSNVIISSIRYFLGLGRSYQEVSASYKRLSEFGVIPLMVNTGVRPDRIDRILAQNLSFSYGDHPVIVDYSKDFHIGNIYHIRGNNGTGKSTFLHVLLGLYSNSYQGLIYINNFDIQNLDMYSIRHNDFAVMLQDISISGESIYEYYELTNDAKYTRGEILNVAQEIGYHDIENIIDSTTLSSDVSSLSSGEIQKLEYIRIALKNSSVMILDEPTSCMDDYSKKATWRHLSSQKEGKIIIVVSHDTIAQDYADEVVTLDRCKG